MSLPDSCLHLPAAAIAPLLGRCRDGFLEVLRGAAAEVMRPAGWLEVFVGAAGECFDELAGLAEHRSFEHAYGLTASRISLIHDEDMDYSIELMNLDQRLREFCLRELAALKLRMRPLLCAPGAARHTESPVGTESVCRALRALTQLERLSPSEALTLLAALEAPLRLHLSYFYRDLERQLAEAMKEALAPPPPPSPPPAPAEPEDWAASPAARSSLALHPLDALRQTVLGRREALPQAAGPLDPGLAAVLVERIEAWLGERQRYGEGVPAALGASELGALLAPARAAAIEVVETVCAYAQARPELPATIRGLLGQLRIPLLRLALRSDTLLGQARHPALLLVDLLARVGRTLAPDCAPELPVCRGLRVLVRSLVRLPRPSDADFEEALDSAEALLEMRRAAALARAAACAAEAARVERREVALHQASRAIYLMAGHEANAVMRDFIEGFWVHVLAKEAYRHGTDSPQWAARIRTANRLLASAAPGLTPAARQLLIARPPALMTDLEEGLARIGLLPAHIHEGLAPCRAVHAELLAGRPAPAVSRRRPASLPSLAAVGQHPHLRVLKHKQYLAGEHLLPPEWGGLEEGACVAVALPDGSVMRGFVALIGPLQHLLVIADGDGAGLLAITGRALAEQVSRPGSALYGDESLVDQAATEKLINP